MKSIQLTRGLFAIVDDEDFDRVNKYRWKAQKSNSGFYATVNKWNKDTKSHVTIQMHRLILGLGNRRLLVDHIDGDGLNNTRLNLRIANKSQNGANRKSAKGSSSKFLGVSWNKRLHKWQVNIKKNYKLKYIGIFSNETDAAMAYNEAAIKEQGEFARLNNILQCT